MEGTKHGARGIAKKRGSPPGTWKYVAGRRPFTVAGYERNDRRLDIWIRFGEHRQRLTDTIRDETGRIDPQLEAQAIGLIAAAQSQLKAGQRPGTNEPEPQGPVTLRRAFDAALAVGKRGLYVTESPQWADMRTLAADICEIFGADTPVESLTSEAAQDLWREIADRVAAGKTRTIKNKSTTRKIPWGGHRMAVRAVDLLFRVLKHHYSGKQTPPPRPPMKWVEKLDLEWQQLFKKSTDPATPRHSIADVAKMMSSLKKADVRLALLLELCAETRLGQARRSMRSNLDLNPGAGVLGHGVLRIQSAGKKKGTVIDLTEAQRKLVDTVMSKGYLQDFEWGFRTGRLKDYPLFPTGRFVKGVASQRQMRPVTRDGLRGWFQDYELKLGIPHVPGRGWYGVRRAASDLAENAVKDARALNLLTGHRGSEMRRGYQDQVSDEVRRLAVQARQAIRKSVQPVPKAAPKKKNPVQVRKRKKP